MIRYLVPMAVEAENRDVFTPEQAAERPVILHLGMEHRDVSPLLAKRRAGCL